MRCCVHDAFIHYSLVLRVLAQRFLQLEALHLPRGSLGQLGEEAEAAGVAVLGQGAPHELL